MQESLLHLCSTLHAVVVVVVVVVVVACTSEVSCTLGIARIIGSYDQRLFTHCTH